MRCLHNSDERRNRALLHHARAPGRRRELSTGEGLPKPSGELHPIQEAFREKHGLQCGFCTPGFLMTTYELLHKHPDADEGEIKEWLWENLCRCTGYQDILESVKLAASRMRNT